MTTRPRAFVRICCFVLIGLFAPLRDSPGQSTLPPPFSGVLQGEAAINALGPKLPSVASAHGVSAQVLANLFRSQADLRVDQDGTLLFICEGLKVASRGPVPAQVVSTQVSGALAPSDGDVFRLHSFPGAARVIYLDFNGHTTTGTKWNTNIAGGADIVSQPFDLDGSPGTFSDSEQTLIRRVWQRVAEDYAPFVVDVTTEDPGIEALRRTNGSDAAYGVRVVISPTNWYSSSAGGVAYIGSFNWNSDTPCFAFTQQLANGEKYLAEAAAHEAGHTLGLYHDGVTGAGSTEYYAGQGNWAPIMGVSYYKPVTQFSRGEYANANNTQDDLSVISSYVPYANDDHGNTLATASVLSGPVVAGGGTIESSADVDLFRFTTTGGTITLNFQSAAPDPDLDLKVELLDSGGQVLQASNPSSLSAALLLSVSSGSYYVRVSGVGAGDPVTNGYSNYGSLGNYVITGTIPSSTTNQPPVAVANASVTSGVAPLTVVFSSAGSHDPDGSLAGYAWSFGNGATSSAENPSYTYTSPGSFTANLTVTDDQGLTNSSSVFINVGSSGGSGSTAPTILAQPANQIVEVGSTATFTIVASGTPAPTVQWYRNGLTWAGWTGSTLSLPGVTSNDVGVYTAVVSNSSGSVTSASATLAIGTAPPPPPPPSSTDSAPQITAQPVSQTASWGGSVTFSVTATGSPTPTVRWYRDGQTWSGWTGSSLTLVGLTSNDVGSYTAVVANSGGSVTSAPATLSVR